MIRKKKNTQRKNSNSSNIGVSVVVPVYNAEKYLKQCVESLINQSYQKAEFIFIDDGSTDNSLSLLKEYQLIDKRIKIIEQENKGTGSARNAGLDVAKGDYVSVVDADDFFELDMLEKAYTAASQNNAEITVFKCDHYDDKEQQFNACDFSIKPSMLPDNNPFSAKDISDRIFNIGCGWAWDKLFKRSFIENNKIRFQETRTTNDMTFVFYLYSKAQKIFFLDELLVHHRVNVSDSLSNTREKSWDNFYLALQELKDKLSADGTYDLFRHSFVNWALNFSLWNIDTLSSNYRKLLITKCRQEFFENLDVLDKEPGYFIDSHEYERLDSIMSFGKVKVSVIVPVYNGEKYLRRCLDSILTQSLQDIQIICVDDGSTDSTPKILKEYESNDERIVIITKAHSNAGDSRNEGLKYAEGDYLSFLDADDFFEPEMLQESYATAKRDEAEICLFRRNQFDNGRGEFIDSLWSMKLEDMPSNRPFSCHDASERLFTMSSCTAWDKLFRRDYILSNNIFFQSIESCNDMLFVFSAFSLANRITTLDKVLAHQRINHPKQLAKDIEYLWSNFYCALMALKNFLIERNVYVEFRNSFINWAIDFSIWNKYNFKEVFRDHISQALKQHMFADLDISTASPDVFFNQKLYEEMQLMLAEQPSEQEADEQPKVSIIIPAYNVEKYLRNCLDSVIYQTLENIEIIVVNDGSTDSSLEIIREYEAKDRRVKVIDKENGGYGKAMNIGLDNATGEYIGIVEPDDFVELKMFKELYSVAKQNDLDFVKADFNRFTHDELGNIVLFYNKIAKEDKNYNKVIKPSDNLWTFRYTMNTWSGIYKREFIENYHIRHNETPGASFQDNGFWFQTFMHADRAMFVNKAYYLNRRDNPNSSVLSTNKIWCMSTEYAHIKSLIEQNSELYNRFIKLLHVTKFRNYMFTLGMISNQDKQEYIRRFHEEYSEAQEKGELDKSLFLDAEWETLTWILKNPDEFLEYNTSDTPKISVIIPVYNMESYLEQCLDSVLYQSLKKIEVICINDGSSDRSLEIIKRYVSKDERVVLIDQENQGVGQSRNNGISIAKGEFIVFMDPDDWYPFKNILENLYVAAKANKVLICGGSFSTFKDGKVITKYQGEYSKYTFDKNGVIEYKDYQFDYGYHRFIYNTEFIRQNNLYFPLYSRYQDPPFFVKAMTTAKRFYAISQIVYRYRKSDKPFVWTREKVNDMVRGILDDIIYSKNNSLDLVHFNSVMRLNKDYLKIIIQNLTKDNIVLLNLLIKINSNIEIELLNKHYQETQNKDEYIIKPLYRVVFCK